MKKRLLRKKFRPHRVNAKRNAPNKKRKASNTNVSDFQDFSILDNQLYELPELDFLKVSGADLNDPSYSSNRISEEIPMSS